MDTSSDRIVKTVLLRAPLERVWRAISEAQQFGAWFGVTFEGPFVEGARWWSDRPHPGRRRDRQDPGALPRRSSRLSSTASSRCGGSPSTAPFRRRERRRRFEGADDPGRLRGGSGGRGRRRRSPESGLRPAAGGTVREGLHHDEEGGLAIEVVEHLRCELAVLSRRRSATRRGSGWSARLSEDGPLHRAPDRGRRRSRQAIAAEHA